jgi:hypothetical protein
LPIIANPPPGNGMLGCGESSRAGTSEKIRAPHQQLHFSHPRPLSISSCASPRPEDSCDPISAQFILLPMMSSVNRAPSRALLSHLRRSPFSAPSPCLRILASRQIRCESKDSNPAGDGRSFKGQLYESTAARLARERTERARFSRDRKEPSGARNAALTFGTFHTLSPGPNC